MSGNTAARGLRAIWTGKARQLDSAGILSATPKEQRGEILRKGCLGSLSPVQVLQLAKQEVELGHAVRKSKFNDEMRRHLRLVGDEVREAVLAILDEVPRESYEPLRTLEEPPG